MAWSPAPEGARLAVRIDETAVAIHHVSVAMASVTILAALMATLMLPWPVCAAWTVIGLTLEAWCWFATRPRGRGEVAGWPARTKIVISYKGVSLVG